MTHLYHAALSNILIKPKRAFKLIKRYDLNKYQFHLLVIISLSTAVNRDFLKLADVDSYNWGRALVLVGAAAFTGWIGVSLWSILIWVTGKWLGGTLSYQTFGT